MGTDSQLASGEEFFTGKYHEETAAIDGLVSSWCDVKQFRFILFTTLAYGFTLLWCALRFQHVVGGTIQVPQLQLQF